MSRYESSQRTEAEHSFVKVVYHPELFEDDVPYNVTVDPEQCSRFLQEYGMSPKRIPLHTIELQRTITLPLRPDMDVLGQAKGKSAILACDTMWKYSNQAEGEKRDPNEIAQHELKHLIDKTLLRFKVIDIATVGLFFGSGSIAGVTWLTLLHQSAFDSAIVAMFVQGGTTVGMPIYFNKDPRMRIPPERRANIFTERIKNDDRWKGLITMTPKQRHV